MTDHHGDSRSTTTRSDALDRAISAARHVSTDEAAELALELCRGRSWSVDQGRRIGQTVACATAQPDDELSLGSDREPNACGHRADPSGAGRWQIPAIGTHDPLVFCSSTCAADYLGAFAVSEAEQVRHRVADAVDQAVEADRKKIGEAIRDQAIAESAEAIRRRATASTLERLSFDVEAGRLS